MPRQRTRRQRRRAARKDRLIQTRVDEDLEQALKREAAKRRLTVSHLIRNTLEDTFHLVEDVTNDVGQIVSGSVELAEAIGRDARRFADIVRGRPSDESNDQQTQRTQAGRAGGGGGAETGDESEGEEAERLSKRSEESLGEGSESPGRPEQPPVSLDHIYGWNRVVANKPARCVSCGASIDRGEDALVGLSDDPTKPRAWLCVDCEEDL